MRCNEIKDKIDAYLERDLSEAELIEIDNHLRACRNCRMEMESIKKCINMMNMAFNTKKPPSEIKKMIFEKTCCNEDERKKCCPPGSKY